MLRARETATACRRDEETPLPESIADAGKVMDIALNSLARVGGARGKCPAETQVQAFGLGRLSP